MAPAAIRHEADAEETKDHHRPSGRLGHGGGDRPYASDAILADVLKHPPNSVELNGCNLLAIDCGDVEEVLAIEVETEGAGKCWRIRQLILDVDGHASGREVIYVEDVSSKSKTVLKMPSNLIEAIARGIRDTRLARRVSARQGFITCKGDSVGGVGIGVGRQGSRIITGDVLKQDVLIHDGRVISRPDDDISAGGGYRKREREP